MDDLTRIVRDAGGKDALDIDQRIQIAQAYALLSVSQEISALNPRNTQYRDEKNVIRNGWGLPTHSATFDVD